MSWEEKSTWITGLIQLLAGLWYATAIVGKASGTPVAEIEYLGELVTMIVAVVVATVAVTIAVAVFSASRAAIAGETHDVDRTDERDKTIARYAGNIGGIVLGVGMVPALGLAVFEFDHFWIAHAIIGAFFASEVVTTGLKIVAYRRGF
ncbi:MAG: hypothetical protein R3246_12360 [Acidimicrobiia bacterium]|nr:hypothetical protein [Acidimicrobiia bacterium]